MGGALSLFAASRNPDVGACVVFYGAHPNVKPDLARLQAPVLGLWAGTDGFATPQAVEKPNKELTLFGQRHQVWISDAPCGATCVLQRHAS